MPEVFKVILLIETSSGFGRQLLRGIADYAQHQETWSFFQADPQMFYGDPRNKQTAMLLSLLKNWRADGMVSRVSLRVAQTITQNLPIIGIDNIEEIWGLPRIIGDNPAIGEMAANKFIHLGYKHFGYCGYDIYWSKEREDGFGLAVSKAGATSYVFSRSREQTKRWWENESQLLVEWLKSLPKPIGVMACNDERGQDVIKAGKLAGVSIPEELSVIGVDNDDMICDLCQPRLSSIALNVQRAGYEAAALLHKLMQGQNQANTNILIKPLYIEERPSTDILAVEDADVAAALRYIRNNISLPITVTDVAKDVCLSRRCLYTKFHAILGRSVHQQIKLMRIERIIKMLATTQMSIAQIADHLGFSDLNHIARYFKQSMGISPNDYRRLYCQAR